MVLRDLVGDSDLRGAIAERHSVRMYTDEPVADEALATLHEEITACNAASSLHIQLISGLDDAFCGYPTHYGRFRGVHNAIALIGAGSGIPDLSASANNMASHESGSQTHGSQAASNAEEIALQTKVGYYGELLSLRIVQLGLGTSWAVLDNAREGWWSLGDGEHMIWALAFGHPARPGAKHHTKPMEQLCALPEGMEVAQAPEWFAQGMGAAMLAPTSLSQQPFVVELHRDTTVSARATEGLFAHVGLGCAMCNFAIGTAPHHVVWR
ncbi:MAG: nitroreductase [Bifidobacterium tibiigranuli]|jgi:hypothetical protein|uniref:nitroreductase family protein n=1 Tax=Bifidobacterium tibiigranuli TaxID=2172043 RepID=UPI0023570096|nr:nitroreductase family protein [Bifidobacterium tibiigranuli]MCH3975629.1 nitroreductase [Bifidobacterium tibiigranuli]MCH4189584.1 nitroreductase [Bifidobacterium tibiigranuli]MCH4204437.1 nitroreductase [Bifidobacterium tibiigranuli]MCH4275179.1 nitroreductase [Bifidobacterium tibiigranuli]